MRSNDHASMYLVDEGAIVAAHDDIIAGEVDLRDHLSAINRALDFIDRAIRVEPHTSNEHLIQLRLSVRLFNSAAAALRLIRGGYWQPAFSIIRDLLETHFLLDLLNHDPQAAKEWISLPDKERKAKFSPVKVRTILDDRDGFTKRQRQALYDNLSRYAAHPTPEGFMLISPDDLTKVGPFPDKKLLRAAMQELAKHAVGASTLVETIVTSTDREFLNLRARYFRDLRPWLDTYLKPRDQSELDT